MEVHPSARYLAFGEANLWMDCHSIPIGVILLNHLNPVYLRVGVGVLLVLYTVYGLARPAIKPMKIAAGPDFGIGIVGGLTGAWWRRVDDLLPMARLERVCSGR